MVNVVFPKRAYYSNCPAVGQKLEVAVMLVELNFSRGSDDIVSPEVVGGDERTWVGEITARQRRDGFLPALCAGGGRFRKAGHGGA